VEIASRIAMEFGGGAPLDIDTTTLIRPSAPTCDPFQRVNDQMLCVSCIHETFSGAMVTHTMRIANQPLLRGAETLIARDEARHIRLGSLYFEWASDLLTDEERGRLARLAEATLDELSLNWKNAVPASSAGFESKDLNELGRLDADAFGVHARKCVREEIFPTLARFGIELSSAAQARILA